MVKPKFTVGDYYESKSGLGFTITEVADGAVTVSVERNVRSKEGRRSLETRTRTVTLADWSSFSGPYAKQRKK